MTIDPRNPSYSAPEGYCPTCEDHTTLIDQHGCCKDCGTEVIDPKNARKTEGE